MIEKSLKKNEGYATKISLKIKPFHLKRKFMLLFNYSRFNLVKRLDFKKQM